MDLMAKEMGLDLLEFRKINLIQDGDFLPTGHHIEHVRARETLETAIEASNWKKPRRPGVGLGIGLSQRHVGIGESNVGLVLDEKGRITVTTLMPDTGRGSYTVLRQIVAEDLKIPIDRVSVCRGSTEISLVSPPANSDGRLHLSGVMIDDVTTGGPTSK
jgi:CO/xanthine dehydrogenase Mo-binding subunit